MHYIEEITQALIWLGFFAAVFLGYYYYLKFRNQERMKLIEQNVDISEIYKKEQNKQHFPWYIVGFTLLGIGLGIVTAMLGMIYIEQSFPDSSISTEVLGFAFIFMFAALGLIVGRSIERKKK